MTAILLLEDDFALRELLRSALEDEGHDVVVLASAERLPECTGERGSTVALVDGWGTGYRELPETDRHALQMLSAKVPTIVMSGRAWVDTVAPEELGVVALLKKPVDLECLLTLVSQSG